MSHPCYLPKSLITRTYLIKMLVEPSAVFIHRDFVDSRKAINGLAAFVEDELNRDVLLLINLTTSKKYTSYF